MRILLLYALALDKYIEVVWEAAVLKYRIEQLQQLIDQALDNWDAEAFYQYSAELAGLKAVQGHGQVKAGAGT
ncbi:IDEAL domain-containing protein [Paenibacillus tianjinensis]|uniref:IDEAL domain-containing protein n=1 Tax=Paenibacillus tianjinensis TaxID=2810347 RepID=A0ABX7L7R3_9BACL|nr:IDEAL domain-containing protein [Paenibacillus tianjinensis]QSF42689.1 IDEAL domain-containing protein [Paenibacillus tianjinensis]